MRLFFFLTIFYGFMIAFGISASYAQGIITPPNAQNPGICVDPPCGNGPAIQGQDLLDVNKINEYMAQIEQSVDKSQLLATIQNAVDKNEQIRNLVAIIQQYGLLTEIQLRAVDDNTDVN